MSFARSVVLAFVALLGSQSLLDAAPTSTPLEEPTQNRINGYTYTPGVGGHKVHSQWVTWNTARRSCEEEGGYLAIVNSVAEADAIVHLLELQGIPKVFVGIHDLYHDEEYVTIHGETVAQTGFNLWRLNEPYNYGGTQHCVILYPDGKYDNINCVSRYPFVCEIPEVQSSLQPSR